MSTKIEKQNKKMQLLLHRVFKQIEFSHFTDHKLSPAYCRTIFDRGLGGDIANFIRVNEPEFYHKKRKWYDWLSKPNNKIK